MAFWLSNENTLVHLKRLWVHVQFKEKAIYWRFIFISLLMKVIQLGKTVHITYLTLGLEELTLFQIQLVALSHGISLPIASFKSHNFHLIHIILFNKTLVITNSRYILAFGFNYSSTFLLATYQPHGFLQTSIFSNSINWAGAYPMCPFLEANWRWTRQRYFSSTSLQTGRADRLLWILMIHGSIWLNYCVANLKLITPNSSAHIGKSLVQKF